MGHTESELTEIRNIVRSINGSGLGEILDYQLRCFSGIKTILQSQAEILALLNESEYDDERKRLIDKWRANSAKMLDGDT